MATETPVAITENGAWVLVKSGAFDGGVQNVGHAPLIGKVVLTAGGAPEAGLGGFSIYSQAVPISILETESLYVRSAGGAGAVVLA